MQWAYVRFDGKFDPYVSKPVFCVDLEKVFSRDESSILRQAQGQIRFFGVVASEALEGPTLPNRVAAALGPREVGVRTYILTYMSVS